MKRAIIVLLIQFVATAAFLSSPVSAATLRAGAAHAVAKDQAVSSADSVITFSEFPVGTQITNQYQPLGILFGGDTPFITTDAANPASPVLSGTPKFSGTITGSFVTPGGQPRSVCHFSLDVGYINHPGSVLVTALGPSGKTIKTIRVNQTGIVPVTVRAPGIAFFSVAETSAESNGFTIDNVAFPKIQTFTITGQKPVPQPPAPPDPASEFAEGSSQLAAGCNVATADLDHQVGIDWSSRFAAVGASDGAAFLLHFLDGTGTPIDRPNGSALSEAIATDSVFGGLDNSIQAQAKKILDSGQRDVDVTSAMYNPDFSQPDPLHPAASLAAETAFGGTQGLGVTGSGYKYDGFYWGSITYVIRDVYGFYATPSFFGVGPMMHYLQGTCGAPWYPGGAHWFYDSVAVTVPFKQPVA
jgi:hypothetical protein